MLFCAWLLVRPPFPLVVHATYLYTPLATVSHSPPLTTLSTLARRAANKFGYLVAALRHIAAWDASQASDSVTELSSNSELTFGLI